MQKLWAPWRMQYIYGEPTPGCLFCRVAEERQDEKNLVLYRGEKSLIMLNAFPYNNGHLMVAPYRHTGNFEDLTPEEMLDLMKNTQLGIRILREALHPDAYNVGMNLGKTAGAGIADHLHQHIVPRWDGDTNFMPVIGDTKVLPDALESTYRKLKEALERLG